MNALIFANGELTDENQARRLSHQADLVIAADGGALHCLRLGIAPHLVVGDLDSLDEAARQRLEAGGARFSIYPPAKDETDLELAMRAAQEGGAQEATILGALGARWDMSLANILLLAHPAFMELRIALVSGPQSVLLARPDRPLVIEGKSGDTISLIPVRGDAAGVSTSGLEYPLRGERLVFGQTRGVSNVLQGNRAEISLAEGLLACVHIIAPGIYL